MPEIIPAWYGDIKPQYRCEDCGHETLEAVRDDAADVMFCPKCGRQAVSALASSREQAEDRG